MSAEERARALASVLSAITVRIRGLRRCSCSTTCRAVCCDRVGGGIIRPHRVDADLAQEGLSGARAWHLAVRSLTGVDGSRTHRGLRCATRHRF